MTDYVIIGVIILLASMTQGFSGFGFQLVSLSLLSFIIDLKLAIPLCALLGLVINIYLLTILRQHIRIFELKRLIIGSMIGIPVGVYFLSKTDSHYIKLFLGVFILLFVVLSVSKFFQSTGINLKWGYFFGVLSGLLGGAFNSNGPPVIIYFQLQGWDKFKLKASITGYFIFSSVLIVISHYISGLTSTDVLYNFIIYLPFVFVGQFAGKYLFGKVSSRNYNKFILGFLFLIGIIMTLG